jgi:hypothetical protein
LAVSFECKHDYRCTYLLEHLVDIGQRRAVKVAVAVHLEALAEAALGHLEDDVLDCLEFRTNPLVLHWQVTQSCQNLVSLIVAALEYQPTRRFGQSRKQDEDEDGQDDLESDGEAPGDGAGLEEGEAEIDPVAEHYTKDDERTLYGVSLSCLYSVRPVCVPQS